jgi:ubiquinone/menaquinone biosynthesis C-methylase UbiE
MPASRQAAPEHIKDVNCRYHDVAAPDYDSKWGIDFGDLGQAQVAAKLRKALGGEPQRPFGRALEIGAGTGYFTLNLLQSGTIERATATDISDGMLAELNATAVRLGLSIETRRVDAESLPFDDASFDLVFGHAVLHHVPSLPRAFAEFHRVLVPGGTIAFCGEPSRYGDLMAAVPKRVARLSAALWRAAVGASRRRATAESAGDHELESEVDVHAFAPSRLRGLLADAGFTGARIGGEELLANACGWAFRTFESTAEPDEVPLSWRRFAFRSYLALKQVDAVLLEPRLPPELFYNLVLSARKPAER